jgi:hypothetical protein
LLILICNFLLIFQNGQLENLLIVILLAQIHRAAMGNELVRFNAFLRPSLRGLGREDCRKVNLEYLVYLLWPCKERLTKRLGSCDNNWQQMETGFQKLSGTRFPMGLFLR